MKIDAIGVKSTDLAKTISFYSIFGFTFPELNDEDQHIEAIAESGQVRLMIDSAEMLESIIGDKPVPSNHSAFAILCESPDEVNSVTKKIKDSGFDVIKEPWDAFWGQRYAIVKDPDGYLIDLFASL